MHANKQLNHSKINKLNEKLIKEINEIITKSQQYAEKQDENNIITAELIPHLSFFFHCPFIKGWRDISLYCHNDNLGVVILSLPLPLVTIPT
jgi:hypothetical protein